MLFIFHSYYESSFFVEFSRNIAPCFNGFILNRVNNELKKICNIIVVSEFLIKCYRHPMHHDE